MRGIATLGILLALTAQAASAPPKVIAVDVDGVVHPITAEIVAAAIALVDAVGRRDAPFLVRFGDTLAIALIVALIGLQMNMISQRAYALVIVMTAVTTMLPPPFLKMLFKPEDKGPESATPGGEPAEVQISGQLG